MPLMLSILADLITCTVWQVVGSSHSCDSVGGIDVIYISPGGLYILVLSLLWELWRGALQERPARCVYVCHHHPAAARCTTTAVS